MKNTKIFGIIVALLLAIPIAFSPSGFPLFESLEVTLLSQDPDPAEPSQYVTLRFKITNIGVEQAEDVKFEILPEYPFSLYSGTALVNIGSIHGKQIGDKGYILKYKLRVDKNAVEGDHEIKLRYKIKNGPWITLDPFTISIRTHDAILSIVSIKANPQPVGPGENVKLTIKVKNVADSLLEYITIKLTLIREERATTSLTYTNFPFSPLDSTNEKTIKNLGTNKEAQITFNLITDLDAASQIYKIPFTITYNDAIGRNYSKDNIITMIIADEPKLSVVVDDSTVHEPGKKGEVTIKFVNKGLADIKFLNVKLKQNHNYELLSSEEVYVGNIDSDDYETADFDIFVKAGAEGDLEFPLYVEYQDDNNRLYSKNFDLSVRLYTKEEALSYGIKEKNHTVGIVIVIVIIVVGLIAYRKFKRKKK